MHVNRLFVEILLGLFFSEKRLACVTGFQRGKGEGNWKRLNAMDDWPRNVKLLGCKNPNMPTM